VSPEHRGDEDGEATSETSGMHDMPVPPFAFRWLMDGHEFWSIVFGGSGLEGAPGFNVDPDRRVTVFAAKTFSTHALLFPGMEDHSSLDERFKKTLMVLQ